jgi:hypothetical protein
MKEKCIDLFIKIKSKTCNAIFVVGQVVFKVMKMETGSISSRSFATEESFGRLEIEEKT